MVEAKRLVSKTQKKVTSREKKPGRPAEHDKKIKPPGYRPEFRMNIGARNPYVLALRQLKSTGEYPGKTGPEYLKTMMEAAYPEVPLEQMFDPKYGSPVYHGIYHATKKALKCHPALYSDHLRIAQRDPGKGPGAELPGCKDLMRSDGQTGVINQKAVRYANDNAAKANFGIEFNDPVQGCVADCWFIASLCSVAWAETNAYPRCLSKANQYPVLDFHPPDDQSVVPPKIYWPYPAEIKTTAEFYTDKASGKKPYYTRTNTTMQLAGYYECWPGYYEKCYAGYWQKNRIPDIPGTPNKFSENDDPDYAVLNFKTPDFAMRDLTGKVTTIKYTLDYIRAGNGPATIITDIRKTPCGGVALANGIFIPTKKPVTAYTYFSGDTVPPEANSPVRVVYDSPGMPANHAFSILGLYQYAGIQYVVLRNPWGLTSYPADFNADCQQYLSTTLATIPKAAYIRDLAYEGIFTLQSSCFMRYFEAFIWTN